MMKESGLKRAAAEIRKHKNFLITVHTSPEGDALGAELAFARLLKKLGKTAVMVNEDPLPQEYNFLPGREDILPYRGLKQKIFFDCMAILDCSDPRRAGEVCKLNNENKPVLNIDHHISNTLFADVNYVSPEASSASELIFRLYKELRVPLDRESALLLYVGIMTDTGSFRYSNTSALVHEICAELLRFKVDVRAVYREIYENIAFSDAQFFAGALSGIRLAACGRVAWVEVTAKALKEKKITFDLSDHILSFIRAIRGVEVAALFRENLGKKGEIRFNLRSNGKVDANKIAQAFGGGGHKSAAGCTLPGKLQDIRRRVIARICKNLLNAK
jgi:phosphoesterase RecJ-like protein